MVLILNKFSAESTEMLKHVESGRKYEVLMFGCIG